MKLGMHSVWTFWNKDHLMVSFSQTGFDFLPSSLALVWIAEPVCNIQDTAELKLLQAVWRLTRPSGSFEPAGMSRKRHQATLTLQIQLFLWARVWPISLFLCRNCCVALNCRLIYLRWQVQVQSWGQITVLNRSVINSSSHLSHVITPLPVFRETHVTHWSINSGDRWTVEQLEVLTVHSVGPFHDDGRFGAEWLA